MKTRKMLFIGATTLLITQVAFTADWGSRLHYESGGNKFSSQELSVDLFGLHASRDRDDFRGGSTFGVGAGVNYFFTENFGVGADTYLDDVHWPRHIDGSFLARYPLERLSLAPYALIGAGRQYDGVAQWTAHVGAGVDFRLNKELGLFTEARHYFADKSKDFSMWRFGIRVVF